MGFESKMLSKEINQLLYDEEKTICTAESCTGGRIAEALIAIPGASKYFKGGIIAYTNEVKERFLNVQHETLEAYTAVSEQTAKEMVIGACKNLGCDFAIASTGVAGPSGGTAEIPVGTIWLAYGTPDDVRTYQLTEDNGRDLNLSIATSTALHLFLQFLQEKLAKNSDENTDFKHDS